MTDSDTSDETAIAPANDGASLVVEEGRSVEIIDETPVNMLIRVYEDDGSASTTNVSKNARNELLYKHGLYDLVYGQGEQVLVLNQDPYAAIASHEQKATFTVWVNDDPPIETPPGMEEDVLGAVRDMKVSDGDSIAPLTAIHATILDTQVRRHVIKCLLDVAPFSAFAERGSIQEDERGWLLHDQLLLTWEGEFRNQSNEERRYEVSGSGVREVESVNEAFQLSRRSGQQDVTSYDSDEPSTDPDDHVTVEFEGVTHTFGKKEVEFVSRVVWALKNVRPRGPAGDAALPSPDQETTE